MKQSEVVTIIHTNDFHSHFEPMPRAATAIEHIRAKHAGDLVIVTDIGDHMDRMRLETEGSGGKANQAVLNFSRYDIVVPGNNEGLTLSKQTLEALYTTDSTFDAVCCNMVDYATREPVPWMQPYRIVSKGDIRVGMIGATADFNDFYHQLGWHLLPPLEAIADVVDRIRSQVDVLVVCSHLGLSRDQEMAETIPGIDCILGGHTHHLLLEPMFVRGTMICATGKFGEYVGEVQFELDKGTKKIVHRQAWCHEVNRYEADPVLTDLIAQYKSEAKEVLSEKVAELNVPLTTNWEKESPIGNLLAQGLKAWTGAELAIVNAGQILRSLDEGCITREIILELCPSPINPCRMKLRGSYIRQALEECVQNEFIQKPIKGFGFRGKVLGTLCLDGMEIRLDETGRITDIYVGNSQLDNDQEYDVATIDMFTFGIGYLSLRQGQDIRYYLPEFIRDILIEELQKPLAIEDSFRKRWIT